MRLSKPLARLLLTRLEHMLSEIGRGVVNSRLIGVLLAFGVGLVFGALWIPYWADPMKFFWVMGQGSLIVLGLTGSALIGTLIVGLAMAIVSWFNGGRQ